MKEKLESKIESIVEFIINKPENEITKEDYEILASELRDIRFREEQELQKAEQRERMSKLVAASLPCPV